MKEKMKRLLTMMCMLVLVVTQIPVGTITVDAASAKKITLNKKNCVIKKGSKVKLKATVLPKKSKVTWKSSNKKVATVNQKGVVAAKKNGKTTITAQAGKKKATCKVVVGIPVSKLTVNHSSLTIVEGYTAQLKASVSPKKASMKTVTYTSKNKKIATVTSKGLVKAIKPGTTKIVVASKDGNKTKKVTVKVNPFVHVQRISFEKTDEYVNIGATCELKPIFAPANASNQKVQWTSENPAVATVDAKGVVTGIASGDATITAKTKDGAFEARITIHVGNVSVVSENEAIAQALQDRSLNYLILKSTEAVNLTIPEGNYAGVTLIVDIPAGELSNYGFFSNVIVDKIASNTMHEYAKGNYIDLRSNQSHLVLENNAAATVKVTTGAAVAVIENKGTLTQLELAAECEVIVSGTANEIIPVSITSKVVLTTNQNLQVSAISGFDMKIRSGAENTTVSVNNRNNIPKISGLGMIPVTITETGDVETIVSNNIGADTDAVDVKFYGAVSDLTNNPIEGASVVIVPYQAGYDINNIEADPNKMALVTNAQGKYELTTIKTGNYILQVKKDGYASVCENLVITSTNGNNFNNQTINLLPTSFDGRTGGVTGKIVESQKGEGLANMTIRIRANQNNLVDSYLYETKTDAAGNYKFENIPAGYYTIQVLDQRQGIDGNSAYLTCFFNILLEPDKTITGQNATLSTAILPAQMRFVLSWGDEEGGAVRDVDSHLIGPDASGIGVFHTSFNDKDAMYHDELYANLDLDDIDWEGPETTTIYKEIPGVYRFYVHDYVNREKTVSDELSNSDVRVEVYSGSFLMSTYHIPKQEGNLWHVCDYDSVSGKLTTVNEMSYFIYNESYDGDNIRNIGMTEDELAFRDIAGVLLKIQEYSKLVDEASAEKLNAIVAEYKQRFEQTNAADEYQNIYNQANTFYQTLEASFNATVTGDCIKSNNEITNTNKLELIIDLDEEKKYQISFAEGCTVEEIKPTDASAVKAYKVTNQNGYVRIIHVYESIDFYDLKPATVTLDNQQMTSYEVDEYKVVTSDDDYSYKDAIYIYGNQPKLTGTVKAKMANGVEGIVGTDTETGLPTVTFTIGLATRTYLVIYEQHPIPNLVDPDNEIYKVLLSGSSNQYITIYGQNEKLGEDYSFEKVDGYNMEIDAEETEEEDTYTELEVVVTNNNNPDEESERYYITYYCLPKKCELEEVYCEETYVDEDGDEYDRSLEGKIDQASNKVVITGKNKTAPKEVVADVNYDVDFKVAYTSEEEYFAVITITYEDVPDYSRVYYVYYEQETSNEIEE